MSLREKIALSIQFFLSPFYGYPFLGEFLSPLSGLKNFLPPPWMLTIFTVFHIDIKHPFSRGLCSPLSIQNNPSVRLWKSVNPINSSAPVYLAPESIFMGIHLWNFNLKDNDHSGKMEYCNCWTIQNTLSHFPTLQICP